MIVSLGEKTDSRVAMFQARAQPRGCGPHHLICRIGEPTEKHTGGEDNRVQASFAEG
jgi:hypothetical protein